MKAKAFIQNIHLFRDDALENQSAPHEKVTIFDEAQRAWDSKQLSKFMNMKRGISGFDQSEPEFLIGVMDRHRDWAVIVCLVGDGQDINTGEAGIDPWFAALETSSPEWQVFCHRVSVATRCDYGSGTDLEGTLKRLGPEPVHFVESLHLSVSVRSFRSEHLAGFVEDLVEGNRLGASAEFIQLQDKYPMALTRDLDAA